MFFPPVVRASVRDGQGLCNQDGAKRRELIELGTANLYRQRFT